VTSRDDATHSLAPRAGDTVELTVHELGYGGLGVARHGSGLVCLVPRALPGEVVRATVTEREPRLARARVVDLVRTSPLRVPAPCPHYAACGGCQLQHLAYAEQLGQKHAVLVRDLARGLGAEVAARVSAVQASPQPFGYRNKALFHVAGGELGFVGLQRDEVVPVAACPVLDAGTQALAERVRRGLSQFGAALDPPVHQVLVRSGDEGGMCVLVTLPSHLARALARRGGDGPWLGAWRDLVGGLSPASVWLGTAAAIGRADPEAVPRRRGARSASEPPFVHLAGPEKVVQHVGTFRLELSPGSFAQANAEVAAAMYARVAAWLAPTKTETALDLYAGSGALALHVAARAGGVVAVEASAAAVGDARANAARNGAGNVDWRLGRCEVLARELVGEGVRFPCASVNPPRAGLAEPLPGLLLRLGVERLVYVSCAPPTLIRDLVRLAALGYEVDEIVPYDLFPQTHHLEVAVRLGRAQRTSVEREPTA